MYDVIFNAHYYNRHLTVVNFLCMRSRSSDTYMSLTSAIIIFKLPLTCIEVFYVVKAENGFPSSKDGRLCHFS